MIQHHYTRLENSELLVINPACTHVYIHVVPISILIFLFIFPSEPGGQAPGGNVGMSMGNTGSNMGMGHGAAGMGMGPGGSSQFPGNMNMMGGPQASGGFNHMMQGGGMGHPGQVRNSELDKAFSSIDYLPVFECMDNWPIYGTCCTCALCLCVCEEVYQSLVLCLLKVLC